MAKRKAPKIKPPPDPESEAWNNIPWRKLEHHCFRIQKRIFRASQRGNTRAVHKLQKLLMKSQSARLLAVRRVTQENQGKKTAGIDGVKSVSPAGRLALTETIHPKRMRKRKPKPLSQQSSSISSKRANMCLMRILKVVSTISIIKRS